LPPLDLDGAGAVAITSANAIPALMRLGRELPVYAVGRATAAAAQGAGVPPRRVATGDGRALAALILRELSPEGGAILHLSGQEVREDFGQRLIAAGFSYRRVVAYAAAPTQGMSPEARQALADGRIDAVLLYSPRSAKLWAERVAEAGLTQALAGLVAVCLSEAVAAPLRSLPLKQVRIAPARDQKALLRCLEAAP
jgi:uroporphyrinogen-III synthase